MDDVLDGLFEGELASINEVFHQFEIKDKKTEKRIKNEEEELEKVHLRNVVDFAPSLDLLEEVSKRRSLESITIEEKWKQEMEALEQESLEALEQQHHLDQEEADIVVQDLDNQLKMLIQTKGEEVKLAQQEKVLRVQREKEEKERKEQERIERLANMAGSEQQELSVEEWIGWMEEKKKKGMTADKQEEYERRKKAWQEKERERAERLKQEEEEKMKKTRAIMENEMRSYRQRQLEVVESRLSGEQLREKQEMAHERSMEASRQRKERGDKMRQDDKDREVEDLRPKARSALAARWEKSVRAHSVGSKTQSRQQHRATVLSENKLEEVEGIEKEEERLIRRISGGFPNGAVKSSPDGQKRLSIQ